MEESSRETALRDENITAARKAWQETAPKNKSVPLSGKSSRQADRSDSDALSNTRTLIDGGHVATLSFR